MKLLSKISVPVLGAFMLGAFSQASAVPVSTTLTYDDLVVSPSPGISTGPWLTADILNKAGSVDITFTPLNFSSGEFITSVYFSLSGVYSLGAISSLNPGTSSLALDSGGCSPGSAPAGTGPWQLCMGFAPSEHYSAGPVTFNLGGVQLSNFVSNEAGWFSVAHLQGINNQCSTWIGAYNGGTKPPVTGNDVGTCGTPPPPPPPPSVPEPGMLSLIGLALAGFGGMRALRKRKAS